MIIITNVKNDVSMSKEELEKRIRDIEKRLKELEYKHAIIGRHG
jgi:chaperonin cofactor prefoldin